jgi:hypothetical protein
MVCAWEVGTLLEQAPAVEAPVFVPEVDQPARQTAGALTEERQRTDWHDLARVIRCRVVPSRGGPPLGATVLGLSARRASLLLRWWLEPGAVVTVRFSRGIYLAPFGVAARVTACDGEGDGRWALKCEFARPLTAGEVAALLG